MHEYLRVIRFETSGGKTARSILIAATVLLFGTGCAMETFAPETAPEYVAIRDFTPLYRFGPQQPGGPDVALKSGARVKLLRREMGYSFVQIEDKRTGYVANENIAVAPPRPRETAEMAAGTAGSNRKPGSRGRDTTGPVYSGPAVNDTPLPDPNVPPPDLNISPELVPDTIPVLPDATPTGTPKFRY